MQAPPTPSELVLEEFQCLVERLRLPAPVGHITPEPWLIAPSGDCVAYAVAGDPALVALGLRGNIVCVGPARLAWDGPSRAEVVVRDPTEVGHLEPGAPLDPGLVEAVQQAVDRSVVRRRRGFRRCAHCHELLPVEMLMESDFAPNGRVCHGCAQTRYGVVF